MFSSSEHILIYKVVKYLPITDIINLYTTCKFHSSLFKYLEEEWQKFIQDEPNDGQFMLSSINSNMPLNLIGVLFERSTLS